VKCANLAKHDMMWCDAVRLRFKNPGIVNDGEVHWLVRFVNDLQCDVKQVMWCDAQVMWLIQAMWCRMWNFMWNRRCDVKQVMWCETGDVMWNVECEVMRCKTCFEFQLTRWQRWCCMLYYHNSCNMCTCVYACVFVYEVDLLLEEQEKRITTQAENHSPNWWKKRTIWKRVPMTKASVVFPVHLFSGQAQSEFYCCHCSCRVGFIHITW
jgi:hypothetical protein